MTPNDRQRVLRRSLALAGLVTALLGCTSRDRDVSYNLYIRNQGNMPVLQAMEEHGPAQCDFWLNDLDARIENAVY
jgi:hypothetical protein